MKFVAQIIDQLVEARNQIDIGTTTNSRLALILTDNAIELLLHKIVTFEFYKYKNKKSPKYSLSKRTKVLRDFNKKVWFVSNQMGLIQIDQANTISVCHDFRNEVYHVNLIRDSIIQEVTKIYFKTCCQLVPKLWSKVPYIQESKQGYSNIRSLLEISDEPCPIFFLKLESAIENKMNSICQNRICSQQELATTLSNDIVNRIEELNENINTPGAKICNSKINIDIKEMLNIIGEYYDERFLKKVNNLIEKYKIHNTKSLINSWKIRGKNLISESSPGNALCKYQSIDSELIIIEEIIGEFIFAYGCWIDLQVKVYKEDDELINNEE